MWSVMRSVKPCEFRLIYSYFSLLIAYVGHELDSMRFLSEMQIRYNTTFIYGNQNIFYWSLRLCDFAK